MNLFKKAAIFGDIHFGLKGGSRIHNNDCEEFVIWFIDVAKKHGCETCIFLGDWHHSRNYTDISTLNYTVSNLERLNNSFEHCYFITGNHDLYYKDKREIHSLEFGKFLPNISLINEITVIDNVSFIPWLVGDEWKRVHKLKSRYMFAHLELPSFFMNANIRMPDHGQLNKDSFVNQEYVFSGHFHKRQTQKNITYIGNAFPHNFSDAGDDNRGMMILEWGGEPTYYTWPNQPQYRVFYLSQVVTDPGALLKEKMNVKIILDVPVSFEEANFIKETFLKEFKLRELMIVPEKTQHNGVETTLDITFESIDKIVLEAIDSVESNTYDNQLLTKLYRSL